MSNSVRTRSRTRNAAPDRSRAHLVDAVRGIRRRTSRSSMRRNVIVRAGDEPGCAGRLRTGGSRSPKRPERRIQDSATAFRISRRVSSPMRWFPTPATLTDAGSAAGDPGHADPTPPPRTATLASSGPRATWTGQSVAVDAEVHPFIEEADHVLDQRGVVVGVLVAPCHVGQHRVVHVR